MNSNRLGRRKFAGAAGSLLLVGLVATSSVFAAGPQPPPQIAGLPLEEETFFLEVRQGERRKADFVEGFGELHSTLGNKRVRVEEVWAGGTRLYLKVALPPDSIAGRNALVEEMIDLPIVAQVTSSHAAPAALQDLHLIEKFGARDAVPNARLRGFREKRRDFRPNLSAPHTGEIIVKYLEAETDTSARLATARSRVGSIHAALGAHVVQTYDASGFTELVSLPSEADRAAAFQAYLDSEDVEYAQPNYVVKLTATPNDPLYPQQWALPKISAPTAWNTRTDASSVVVAVVDTGIDYNHPDLAANMWVNPNPGQIGVADGVNGADFYGTTGFNPDADPMDTYGHGTHVAGIIGAVGNNSTGIAGVAWRAKLMAVRVGQGPGLSSSAIEQGLDYARLKGAKIVNASWNTFEYTFSSQTPSLPPYDPALEGAIRRPKDSGVVFVNSSGNDSWNCDLRWRSENWPHELLGNVWVPLNPYAFPEPWNPLSLPHREYFVWYSEQILIRVGPGHLSLPNMLVVNSSDYAGGQSNFSNYGRWATDIHAFGGLNYLQGLGIRSTLPGNQYGYMQGTSMAAPQVSGVLALAKAEFPWESWRELVDRIRCSNDPLGLGSNSVSGGELNAAKALGTRPRLVNLSTRCQVNTGFQVAIAGLWIGGPAAKVVALRAQGPTLGTLDVPNPLPNPQITIFNGSGQAIGYNDDWGTLSPADKAVLASVGATPFDPLESAWVGTLAPGGYTVHLSGAGGTTGIGIVESFDGDGSTQNRLINVSTRCYVGAGAQVAIAGTFVVGDKPRIVYIRALGPTLETYGVPGVLQDPVITLFQGSTVIASNDNWGGSGTAFGTRLVENGNAPSDYRESALIARLEPNSAYTVHLSGKSSTTGIGIIEIYEC